MLHVGADMDPGVTLSLVIDDRSVKLLYIGKFCATGEEVGQPSISPLRQQHHDQMEGNYSNNNKDQRSIEQH